MKNNLNNNFTIFTISVPTPNQNKSGFSSAIASTFSLIGLTINWEKVYHSMNFLQFKNYYIIFIVPDDEKVGENGKSEEYFIKKFDTGNQCKITLLMSNFSKFFTTHSFRMLFDHNKDKSYEYIFIVKGYTWKEITFNFSVCGIDISGGSNNKKHILSPLQFKLSLFLSCVYGGSQASIEVTKSFHRSFNENDKKEINYSLKSVQNKIIDFAQADEIFKARILGEDLYTKKIEDLFDKKTIY